METAFEKVLAEISSIIKDTNTSLSEDFYKTLLKRLVTFGYELQEDDSWILCFTAQKTENHIKTVCNTSSLPNELFYKAVDMVCGEFLFAKKQTGNLELANIDIDGAIKQISEGDVSISFVDGSSDEDKLNAFLNSLLRIEEGDLICYRKLKW